MRTSLFAAASTLAILAFSSFAQAQTARTRVFQTVDAYGLFNANYDSHDQRGLAVTGLVVGQTAPTTLRLNFEKEADRRGCEAAAAQVLNRPGRLRLTVDARSITDNELDGALCTISRVP